MRSKWNKRVDFRSIMNYGWATSVLIKRKGKLGNENKWVHAGAFSPECGVENYRSLENAW